jgi:hypothetical protein
MYSWSSSMYGFYWVHLTPFTEVETPSQRLPSWRYQPRKDSIRSWEQTALRLFNIASYAVISNHPCWCEVSKIPPKSFAARNCDLLQTWLRPTRWCNWPELIERYLGQRLRQEKSSATRSLRTTTSMLDITQSRDWEGRSLAAVRDWVAVCVCK